MRLTRSRVKKAAKDRHRRKAKLRSTDGPQCPHCEPHINAKLNKETERARRDQKEMEEQ
jgi:hypothetical protein